MSYLLPRFPDTVLPCLLVQVDEAVSLATRDWTIGAFAIFVWLVSCAVLIWMIKRKDAVIADLARQMAEQSKEQTEDLKQQREEGREDTRRSEAATLSMTEAVRGLQEKWVTADRRLEAIQQKLNSNP